MKILVTGGAGYCGVMLTAELLKSNYEVTVIDNFMYGYDSILHLMHYNKLHVVKKDIRDNLRTILRKHDVIFHLAGLSGYPACEANPSSAHLINVDATQNIVNSLSSHQLLIFASTTSIYGNNPAICDELIQPSPSPANLYARTKYQAEQIVMQKENAISFRFATIFGISPKMRIDLLVNDFAYKAVHDRCIVLFEASTKRTFLHIKDAVKAYILALDKRDAMKNNIYNVGNESMNFTKSQIAKSIKKITNCEVIDSPIKDVDCRNFTISFRKINKLGFQFDVGLEEGIQELVKLYQFYKPLALYQTI